MLELGGVHEIARRLNTSEARFVFFSHLKPGGIVNIFYQSFPHFSSKMYIWKCWTNSTNLPNQIHNLSSLLHLQPCSTIINVFCQSFPHYRVRGPLVLKCSPENVEQIQQSCQTKPTTCHPYFRHNLVQPSSKMTLFGLTFKKKEIDWIKLTASWCNSWWELDERNQITD